MKLNKKGITLVEIIISIALISIVLIFLFSLLITVNDMNNESQINSTYLVNKALITKNIEENIKDANELTLDGCNVKDFYSLYGEKVEEEDYFGGVDQNKAEFCLQFNITKDSGVQEAYLGIYYYNNKNQYVISYINESESIKATRILPEFKKNNIKLDHTNGALLKQNPIINNSIYSISVEKTISNTITLDGFSTITIPIVGDDGKDYTIVIPFSPKTI